jgi:hypothetical protein
LARSGSSVADASISFLAISTSSLLAWPVGFSSSKAEVPEI